MKIENAIDAMINARDTSWIERREIDSRIKELQRPIGLSHCEQLEMNSLWDKKLKIQKENKEKFGI